MTNTDREFCERVNRGITQARLPIARLVPVGQNEAGKMKAQAKMLWDRMNPRQQENALTYYCNLSHQVHHNCEHGGVDFATATVAELIRVARP